MKTISLKPITITYVKTISVFPTDEFFADLTEEPTQTQFHNMVEELIVDTIKEECNDGEWKQYAICTYDDTPVEIKWGEE